MDKAKVFLGRDVGFDDISEEDFQAWGDYVAEHLSEKLGAEVEVWVKGISEPGQWNTIEVGLTGLHKNDVKAALNDLWDGWLRGR